MVWSVDWRRLGSESHGHSSRIAFTTICSSTVAAIREEECPSGWVDLAAQRRDQISISRGGVGAGGRERAMPLTAGARRRQRWRVAESLCWGRNGSSPLGLRGFISLRERPLATIVLQDVLVVPQVPPQHPVLHQPVPPLLPHPLLLLPLHPPVRLLPSRRHRQGLG